jgi:hypothetical protein
MDHAEVADARLSSKSFSLPKLASLATIFYLLVVTSDSGRATGEDWPGWQ